MARSPHAVRCGRPGNPRRRRRACGRVFFRLAKPSRQHLARSLRVPPLILRHFTWPRMSPSLPSACRTMIANCPAPSLTITNSGENPFSIKPPSKARNRCGGVRQERQLRCFDRPRSAPSPGAMPQPQTPGKAGGASAGVRRRHNDLICLRGCARWQGLSPTGVRSGSDTADLSLRVAPEGRSGPKSARAPWARSKGRIPSVRCVFGGIPSGTGVDQDGRASLSAVCDL